MRLVKNSNSSYKTFFLGGPTSKNKSSPFSKTTLELRVWRYIPYVVLLKNKFCLQKKLIPTHIPYIPYLVFTVSESNLFFCSFHLSKCQGSRMPMAQRAWCGYGMNMARCSFNDWVMSHSYDYLLELLEAIYIVAMYLETMKTMINVHCAAHC